MLKIRESKFFLSYSCSENQGASSSQGPADDWPHLIEAVAQHPENQRITVLANVIFEHVPGLHIIELVSLAWPPSTEKLDDLRRLLADTPLAVPDNLVVIHKVESLDPTPAQ